MTNTVAWLSALLGAGIMLYGFLGDTLLLLLFVYNLGIRAHFGSELL